MDILRRDFLIGTSSLAIPDAILAQAFNVQEAAQELADALRRRDGGDWQSKVEPDFILIFRKAG